MQAASWVAVQSRSTHHVDHRRSARRLRVALLLGSADTIALPQARAAVKLRDGRRIEAQVSDCHGSAGRPMTDAEIGAKFRDQVCLRMPKAGAESLLEQTWRVDEAADVGSFARRLATV